MAAEAGEAIDMNASELLRPSEAMAVLGIRHRDTLRRLRRCHPEIAVKLPGMKHHRYRRAQLVHLVQHAVEGGQIVRVAKIPPSVKTSTESAVQPSSRTF